MFLNLNLLQPSIHVHCLRKMVISRAAECIIQRSHVRFLLGLRIFLGPMLMTRGNKIFHYFFTKLKICHLSYSVYKHDAINNTDHTGRPHYVFVVNDC